MISLKAYKNCQELSKVPSDVQQRIIEKARKETHSLRHEFVGFVMAIAIFMIYTAIQPFVFPSFPLKGRNGMFIAGALGGIYGIVKLLYDRYYHRNILQPKIRELVGNETINDRTDH
jgi:hypothetical protein